MNQDTESANGYYQKALALDPKDPVARAGLDSLPRIIIDGLREPRA